MLKASHCWEKVKYQFSQIKDDNRHDYVDDDERKMLAVANLQAMLNLDDFDMTFDLLQRNNWDESVW